jgi:shikimate dehydrogenase
MSSSAVQPLLALVAAHVGGNPTQYMFEKAFAHHELDWRYLTFEIEPENLGDAVRGLRVLGFRGGHCGSPHKQAVSAWLDRTTDTAAMIGSVNSVFRDGDTLVGDNIEGKGVVQAIRGAVDLAGKRAVLLGAGNAARAVAVELAAAGVAELAVVNRAESRATELATMLATKFQTPVATVAWQGEFAVPPETDILIHATSLARGSDDMRPSILIDTLRPGLTVADLTAVSSDVGLLAAAGEHGCKTIDGLSMIIEQAAIGFRLWTGVDPNRQVLREAAEEFLGL